MSGVGIEQGELPSLWVLLLFFRYAIHAYGRLFYFFVAFIPVLLYNYAKLKNKKDSNMSIGRIAQEFGAAVASLGAGGLGGAGFHSLMTEWEAAGAAGSVETAVMFGVGVACLCAAGLLPGIKSRMG